MKKITLLCSILFALAAHAQNRYPPINLYNGDPTGSPCTFPASPMLQSETTGYVYSCSPTTLVYQQVAAGGVTYYPAQPLNAGPPAYTLVSGSSILTSWRTMISSGLCSQTGHCKLVIPCGTYTDLIDQNATGIGDWVDLEGAGRSCVQWNVTTNQSSTGALDISGWHTRVEHLTINCTPVSGGPQQYCIHTDGPSVEAVSSPSIANGPVLNDLALNNLAPASGYGSGHAIGWGLYPYQQLFIFNSTLTAAHGVGCYGHDWEGNGNSFPIPGSSSSVWLTNVNCVGGGTYGLDVANEGAEQTPSVNLTNVQVTGGSNVAGATTELNVFYDAASSLGTLSGNTAEFIPVAVVQQPTGVNQPNFPGYKETNGENVMPPNWINGSVTALTFTNNGSCSVKPNELVSQSFSGGQNFTYTLTWSSGPPYSVTGYTITNAGYGYATAPQITIAGGTCTTYPAAYATVASLGVWSADYWTTSSYNFGSGGGRLASGGSGFSGAQDLVLSSLQISGGLGGYIYAGKCSYIGPNGECITGSYIVGTSPATGDGAWQFYTRNAGTSTYAGQITDLGWTSPGPLSVNGCTIGSLGFCVTGNAAISGSASVASLIAANNQFLTVTFGASGYSNANLGLDNTAGGGDFWQWVAAGTGGVGGAHNTCWNDTSVAGQGCLLTITSAGDLQNINYHTFLPHTVTGYNGNASGVKLPLALGWNTPSSITSVCHDANGNLTDASCPSVNATQINGGAAPTSANLGGWNSSGQPISEETDLGTITYTSSGTTTFAAASAFNASGVVTATHSTSTTFSPTNLVKWGNYLVEIKQDTTGGGVTFTLGTGGTCSAWKVGGAGSGAITLSTAANAIDILTFTYDGTNCVANFRTNFN